MPNHETVDVLVIGSGMGGATFSAGLAPSGAKILILERGERLLDSEAARDARAIFQRGVFRPRESWLDGAGQSFNPGNYYYVGGNTKLYGAVLIRNRAQDFEPISYREGTTTGWPFTYDELEPWYTRAEKLLPGSRSAGFRPHRAAPFGALSVRPGSGRASDRKSPRTNDARGAKPVSLAAGPRPRQMAETREDALGRLSRHGMRQDGRRKLRRQRSVEAPECRASHQCSRRETAGRAGRQAHRRRRSRRERRAPKDRRQVRGPGRGRGQLRGAAA